MLCVLSSSLYLHSMKLKVYGFMNELLILTSSSNITMLITLLTHTISKSSKPATIHTLRQRCHKNIQIHRKNRIYRGYTY